VLSFAPFAPLEIDAHDGVMLKPAMDVLSGHVLFRDTVSPYGQGQRTLNGCSRFGLDFR
jgi:hypothetical protein